jgi:hypothetical protein
MGNGLKSDFSGPVTVFQDRRLPELATPVGYAALIDAFRPRRRVRSRRSASGTSFTSRTDGISIHPGTLPRRLSKGI